MGLAIDKNDPGTTVPPHAARISEKLFWAQTVTSLSDKLSEPVKK